MYRKTLKFHVCLVIVLVLTLAASCTPSVTPSVVPSEASIKIDVPASSVQVADTVRVSIKAENVANLTAFETHLSFDANALEVVEVINGSFIKADFIVQNTFDNALGTIDYAIAQVDTAPASGNGTLFEIVFRAKTKGDAIIRFRGTQAAPEGMLLSDPNGMAIQVLLMEGSMNVK